jgi:DUF2075 family protein/SOS-response transcriptional repressor LexA/predicted GIY-YIG superfamily endonuclease
MNAECEFDVTEFKFNRDLLGHLVQSEHIINYWPVVYILNNGKGKEAYVGETIDALTRMSAHLKDDAKQKLNSMYLVASDKFNKSATLDIESNLIKYISGDGIYKLLNINVGLANHQFYEKAKYWALFQSLWNDLRAKGLAKHSLQYIDNSNLFKYSPYKSLAPEQKVGLMMMMNSLLNDFSKRIVVEGGAGTGKTILAIFLFKLLKTDIQDFNFSEFGNEEELFIDLVKRLKEKYPDPKMALVIPMSSFRTTVKKVFNNVKGLNANMVIGPSEMVNDQYDIVLVDESHRLRQRVNLASYFEDFDIACAKLGLNKMSCSELDWVLMRSDRSIFFYDEKQSIKPSDANKADFDRLKSSPYTTIEKLKSQFRVRGGYDYISYIDKLLNCTLAPDRKIYQSNDYEFLLFDSLDQMIAEIKSKNEAIGLARLIAGFSWEWKTKAKKNRHLIDIQIGDTSLRWNSKTLDWTNSKNAIDEVGCIHTTQGYDLNYAGIIFGNEISYDELNDEIVIYKENYFDKNGKNTVKDPKRLKSYILNIYNTILQRGIRGTYVYVCDPKLRDYLAKHIAQAKVEQPLVKLDVMATPTENSVPFYDLYAAAGNFSDLQHDTTHQWVKLQDRHSPDRDLFACRVIGESMNKVIPNGSICLFRKYTGGSRNGRIVLARSTTFKDLEFGSGYTVKEYHSAKNVGDEGWNHTSIVLKPLSYDPKFQNIKLTEDELDSFKVIGIFEGVLA